MPRLMFTNLPITDLAASKAFFSALGFTFNEKFENETTTCMVVNEQSFVMLIEHEQFAGHSSRPIADAGTNAVLLCVSADDRAGVDAFAEAALAAGATPAGDPEDHGFMYGRSFADLDGHCWEVMWMDAAAVEQGPAEFAESA